MLRGRSPLCDFENRKEVDLFRKRQFFCLHLWVKFSFKMQFKDCLGEKALKLSPTGLFRTLNVYRGAPIGRNNPFTERFLVVCMGL